MAGLFGKDLICCCWVCLLLMDSIWLGVCIRSTYVTVKFSETRGNILYISDAILRFSFIMRLS